MSKVHFIHVLVGDIASQNWPNSIQNERKLIPTILFLKVALQSDVHEHFHLKWMKIFACILVGDFTVQVGCCSFKSDFRYHQQNLTWVDQHASRIPKMYCMKS